MDLHIPVAYGVRPATVTSDVIPYPFTDEDTERAKRNGRELAEFVYMSVPSPFTDALYNKLKDLYEH